MIVSLLPANLLNFISNSSAEAPVQDIAILPGASAFVNIFNGICFYNGSPSAQLIWPQQDPTCYMQLDKSCHHAGLYYTAAGCAAVFEWILIASYSRRRCRYLAELIMPHRNERCLTNVVDGFDCLLKNISVYHLACRPDQQAVRLLRRVVLEQLR